MVCLDNLLISGSKDEIKLKTQDCHKIVNLVVTIWTKTALVKIFIFQIFNVILIWLYLLLTPVFCW